MLNLPIYFQRRRRRNTLEREEQKAEKPRRSTRNVPQQNTQEEADEAVMEVWNFS